MKFDPPILSEGPLSGAVFVTTHGKILSHDDEGRPLIESSVKYDVTDQFEALVAARDERRRLEACPRCGNERYCSRENPTCPMHQR